MKFNATITDAGPYLLSKKEMRDIGRDSIEAAGKLWHYLFKRRHFQMEAMEMYKYKPRSKKYRAKKAAVHPEASGRPLVYTGESERLAMASNKVNATAKDFAHYHADVIVNAPQLNRQRLYGEMVVTTAEEDEAMQAKFAEVFADGVAAAWKSHGLSSSKIELGRQQLSAA